MQACNRSEEQYTPGISSAAEKRVWKFVRLLSIWISTKIIIAIRTEGRFYWTNRLRFNFFVHLRISRRSKFNFVSHHCYPLNRYVFRPQLLRYPDNVKRGKKISVVRFLTLFERGNSCRKFPRSQLLVSSNNIRQKLAERNLGGFRSRSQGRRCLVDKKSYFGELFRRVRRFWRVQRRKITVEWTRKKTRGEYCTNIDQTHRPPIFPSDNNQFRCHK